MFFLWSSSNFFLQSKKPSTEKSRLLSSTIHLHFVTSYYLLKTFICLFTLNQAYGRCSFCSSVSSRKASLAGRCRYMASYSNLYQTLLDMGHTKYKTHQKFPPRYIFGSFLIILCTLHTTFSYFRLSLCQAASFNDEAKNVEKQQEPQTPKKAPPWPRLQSPVFMWNTIRRWNTLGSSTDKQMPSPLGQGA